MYRVNTEQRLKFWHHDIMGKYLFEYFDCDGGVRKYLQKDQKNLHQQNELSWVRRSVFTGQLSSGHCDRA